MTCGPLANTLWKDRFTFYIKSDVEDLFTQFLLFEDREEALPLEAFIHILVTRFFLDGTCNAGTNNIS